MPKHYLHTLKVLPQIKEMLEQGMTQKEVENALGLVGDRPIHQLLNRERKKELQGNPKQRRRKPAKTLHEYKYSISRMCSFFGVSRMGIVSWDMPLAQKIRQCQERCSGKTYGYRRVHLSYETLDL